MCRCYKYNVLVGYVGSLEIKGPIHKSKTRGLHLGHAIINVDTGPRQAQRTSYCHLQWNDSELGKHYENCITLRVKDLEGWSESLYKMLLAVQDKERRRQ